MKTSRAHKDLKKHLAKLYENARLIRLRNKRAYREFIARRRRENQD